MCQDALRAVVQGKGRAGIPPGVYFRILIVGYFEGIQSSLGLPRSENTPDHSSLSHLLDRLSHEVHDAVFAWVLKLARENQLLNGKTVGVDSSTLEANVAMKSIVRRDTGEDWEAYVTQQMKANGVVAPDGQPTADEIRNFDRQRADKRVANDEWVSPIDDAARIARMKDGTTHLAYKAEHIVDLDSNLIRAAEIYPANQADVATLEDSVHAAQTHQASTGSAVVIEDVVADKEYHSAATLETMATETPYETFIPELRHQTKNPPRGSRTGSGRHASSAKDEAERANRQQMNTDRGRRLQRRRSEPVERTFAHLLETGGGRRTWHRGIGKVRKHYSIAAGAHNLGILMHALFGIGTPKGCQPGRGAAADALSLLQLAYLWLWGNLGSIFARFAGLVRNDRFPEDVTATMLARV
ncbi:MAG: transposase [Pirellulales bacterium]